MFDDRNTSQTAWALQFPELVDARAVSPMPVMLDRRWPGEGKTQRMAEFVAEVVHDNPDASIHALANTTKLAALNIGRIGDAYRRLYRTAAPEFTQWVGFDALDAMGEPVCRFPVEAELLKQMGASPYKLCLDPKTGKHCRFAEDCPIFKQLISGSRRWAAAHQMLAERMRGDAKPERVNFTLIDEDPLSALLQSARLHLSSLPGALGIESVTEAELAAAAERIDERFDGLKEEIRTREGGTVRRLSGSELVEAVGGIYRHLVTVYTDKTRVQWQQVAPQIREVTEQLRFMAGRIEGRPNPDVDFTRKLKYRVRRGQQALAAVKLLDALHECCRIRPGEAGELAGVRLCDWQGAPTIEAHFLKPVHDTYRGSLFAMLSATAQAPLVRRLFGAEVEDVTPPMEPFKHARLIRVIGGPSSAVGLMGQAQDELTTGGLRTHENVHQLAHRYRGKAKPRTDGLPSYDLLGVGQLKLEGFFRERGLPDNADFQHFNSLEGLDAWDQVAAEYVVGRPLATMATLHPQAEVLAGEVIEMPDSPFPPTRRIVETTKAGGSYTIRAVQHPHPMFDGLIKSITHAAIIQAIRARPRWRTKEWPVDIYIQCELDLGIKFDAHIYFLAISGWYGQLAARGFVPLLPPRGNMNRFMAALLPDQFKGATAFRLHRQQRERTHGETLETLAETHGFIDPIHCWATLPGTGERGRVRLLVNARSQAEAVDLLTRELPEGSKIEAGRNRPKRSDDDD